MVSNDLPPLARFAGVLTRANGRQPTAQELAELLWLAGHSSSFPDELEHPLEAPEHQAPSDANAKKPVTDFPRIPARNPDDSHAPLYPDDQRDVVQRPTSASTLHARLLAPTPPMLAHPLPLQRALRPLSRQVPAPVGWELDEEETAESIARQGAGPGTWQPVLKPKPERWLTLHLVFDSGPTMPIWRPLERDLHRMIVQTGAFRMVERWQVTADGAVRRHDLLPSRAVEQSSEAFPLTDSRTVTLVVSDCMGPQWRDGAAADRWYRTLHRWTTSMPVAVVQALPERLWRRTALPTTAGLVAAPRAVAPNSALRFAPYGPSELPEEGSVPLPVLEPTAAWLAHWSALVAGPGSVEMPGVLAHVPKRPHATEDPDVEDDFERLSPEDLVLRFRSVASPEAFRLAGHLAVGTTPSLPVMRLIQKAVEQQPQPQQLAEVVLSGMLKALPDFPSSGRYEFRPGVREVLLRTLPRSSAGHTADVLARVSDEIKALAGFSPGEFPALARLRRELGVGTAEPTGDPFALVSQETLRLLRPTVRPAAQEIRVAIVEDHPIVRRRLEDTLSQLDQVRVVASVERPAAQSMPRDVDVVVIDLYGDTLQPSRTAVAELSKRTGVLLMSAAGRPADVLDCVRAGASGYVTKHASGATFASAVTTVAAGGFVLSAELADILHSELTRNRPSNEQVARLTPREEEMLGYFAEGLTPVQVARRMQVTVSTVDAYIEHIRAKLQDGGAQPR